MAEIMAVIVKLVVYAVITIGVCILIGIFVGIMWWFNKNLRWKVRVDIYEKVGGSYRGFTDLARESINKLEGGKRRTFLYLRQGYAGSKKLSLPESYNYVPFGSRKKLNLLFKDGLFTPLPLVENSDAAFTHTPSDVLKVLFSWDADYYENLETHKGSSGFWDKYGTYVGLALLYVLNFVMFMILINQLKGGGGGGGISLPQIIS